MNGNNSTSDRAAGRFPFLLKTFLLILEISLVFGLLIAWFSSESIQQSKNLWVLFLYSFPSEFLISIVPHEPALLYFSKFYSPLTVAWVAAAGTLLAEMLNYSVFKYVMDLSVFQKIRHKKTATKIIAYFRKAPFLALWIAGFTPVPFYPFRFLVVMAPYPLWRYILAVALSRTPRFYILALAGHAIKFSDSLLIIFFVTIVVAVNLPILRNIRKRRPRNAS